MVEAYESTVRKFARQIRKKHNAPEGHVSERLWGYRRPSYVSTSPGMM
jgi:hypothetical protein